MTTPAPRHVGCGVTRPVLLDLFSGAGGAGEGYHRAGFRVIGVDIRPMPRYPHEFVQADAMQVLQHIADGTAPWPGAPYPDAIHASPPCQAYSQMTSCRPGLAAQYPALVDAVNPSRLPRVPCPRAAGYPRRIACGTEPAA